MARSTSNNDSRSRRAKHRGGDSSPRKTSCGLLVLLALGASAALGTAVGLTVIHYL